MPTASAPRVSAYVYRIPLYFLLVSLSWVLVTDKVLDLFILDHLEEAWLQTAKETALLLAVTVLLHRFLRTEDRLQQDTLAKLRDSEAEADEKRRLLEAVIAASPLPMIILDSQGLVRQWSPAAERVFGWTGAETLGKPLPYMDASLEEENRLHASQVLSGQTILGKHIVRRCKRGKRLDLMLNAAPVSLEARGVVGAMAMFEDVTEKIRLQTERDTFFVNSVDMLCIARTDGFFQQINPAWTKTLGWSEAELLTTPWLEFVHPDDRPDTELVRQWLSQGNPYRYFENRYRHKDGSWRWLAWSSMVPSEGNLIFAVARDITEERQARENLTRALEAANAATAAKDAFLMNIGHELRTPLHGILGMVQLGMRENDPVRHAEFWKTAGDSARSLLETINNLLDLTAIEAGDITPTPRSFSPATLLDVLFQQYAQRAGAKGLGFSLRVDPALPAAIFADEGFHRRILMSLLDNALRFTPQGSVSLEAELLADATMATGATPRLRYTVRDTGVGVAPNRQQHIFERFGLAEDYLTKRYGGAGVGLSIAAKLVHALDGTVSLDSRPGEGSIFTVVLPAPPVQEEAPAPEPCPAGPRVVLVVEDEAVSRLWLGLTLRRHGCQVLEADSGEAALAELGRSRVDVVLLDIQMPGVDGLEVLRRIRSGEAGVPPDLPVIVTTAHTSRGDRARYREAGMTDMLSKPFTVAELVAVLGRVGVMGRDAAAV